MGVVKQMDQDGMVERPGSVVKTLWGTFIVVGKSIPSRGHSRCECPEARTSLACVRTGKRSVHRVGQGRTQDKSPRETAAFVARISWPPGLSVSL